MILVAIVLVDGFVGVCFFSPKTFSTESSLFKISGDSQPQFLLPNICLVKMSRKKNKLPSQHIPPGEKECHLQKCLGRGYVSSQESIQKIFGQHFLFGSLGYLCT